MKVELEDCIHRRKLGFYKPSPFVQAAKSLEQDRLIGFVDGGLSAEGCELNREQSLAPGQQTIDGIGAFELFNSGVGELPLRKGNGRFYLAARERYRCRLASDLKGLNQVDDGEVGEVAIETRRAVRNKAPPSTSAQEQLHSRYNFFDENRLAKVLINANLNAADPFVERRVATEHHQGQGLPPTVGTQTFAEVETGGVMQLGVGDNEIWIQSLYLGERVSRRGRSGYDIAGFAQTDL